MKLWLFAFVAVSALSLLPPPATRAGTLPNISGTWFASGDRTRRCRIEQSGLSLNLRNEDGWTATGSFVNPSQITTTWGSFRTTITGRISDDLLTIRWSNGTFWSRPSANVEPAATPTPNPFREIRLASQTLEATPQGKIALLGGWAAVRRDGRGAVVCISFKNEAAVAATRVVFRFTILDRLNNDVGHLELDRSGDFSPGIAINGWSSLRDWQGGVGHRGFGDNCKTLNSSLATLPLLSAHAMTYDVKHVQYADGTTWPP